MILMKHFYLSCFLFYGLTCSAQLALTTGAATCTPGGIVCVGSGCASLNLVSDGNVTTAGTMTTAIGVGCSNTLAADFATVQTAGRWAGFYVSGGNLLTLVSSITVTFRNTSTSASEQVSGSTLLSVLGNGKGLLQFQSTISFNRIELTLNGIASVLQSVDVYTGFSSSILQVNALAVSWLSFTANEQNGKVMLAWSTASEENSDYFILERSVDGIHYSPIANIKAAGTTSSQSDYSFTDNMPVAKTTNYYRLKQTDFDGRYNYSQVKYALVEGNSKLIRIAPNPARDYIILNGDFHLKRIRIYDTYGKEIMIKKLSGTQLQLDISSLATGTYVLTIDDNNRVIDQQKLIIIK